MAQLILAQCIHLCKPVTRWRLSSLTNYTLCVYHDKMKVFNALESVFIQHSHITEITFVETLLMKSISVESFPSQKSIMRIQIFQEDLHHGIRNIPIKKMPHTKTINYINKKNILMSVYTTEIFSINSRFVSLWPFHMYK